MAEQGDQVGSRRERKKEARRKTILEAAFQAFTERGFTATKLDDVALRAGIGKGTIYLYFQSKEALFEEVVRENLFPVRDAAEDQVAEFQGTAARLLSEHLHYIYGMLADEKIPPLIAMVIGEGNRFPGLTDFFFEELVSRTQENMRSIIKKGVDSGEFRDTGVADYPQILVAPVLISAIWKLQFEALSPIDLEAFARTHVDIILKGLKIQQ